MNMILKSLRFPAAKRRPAKPAPLIDVKRRAADLTDEELAEGANSYFARLGVDSVQFRKPFSDPQEVVALTQHVSLLFQSAQLFRGARVLHFGCATGWLSLAMAQMGCDVVGVDIAASAIKLAERTKTRRIAKDGQLEFRTYAGKELPFADASFDRIVCLDAFHHVRDQALVMREFARVLKDGGRVAFVEPGPHHSSTQQSQAEMQRFKVLENDIRIQEVAAHARAAGLDAPEMLVQFQRPLALSLDEFVEWSDKGIPVARAHSVLSMLQRQMTDAQFFSVRKGEPQLDSRQISGLGAELELREIRREGPSHCSFRLLLRNTGSGVWITQPGKAGQVRVGCQLFDNTDTLTNLDYARFDLPSQPVPPGTAVEVQGRVKLPLLDAFKLRFDVVSEQVTWFAACAKSLPVDVRSENLVDE